MDFYPAIDLRGGKCVRLVEGDFGRETVYGKDPVQVAKSFEAAGATWVHVVDLDAALTGEPVNRPVVARIAAAVPGMKVQAGGGVRSAGDASTLLDGGVERVVLGTASVTEPDLVAEIASRWPGRVAVGLDHRGGEVRVRGWTEAAIVGTGLADLVRGAVAAGAAAVVVTDISRDGRLSGPDVEGLADLLSLTGGPIVASGGVRGVDDLRALAAARSTAGQGLAGVIAGRALYEGALAVTDALEALR
ncbi:MAG: 1-(5-phosphoribosyl)-5-[(5-phosphoribosylamino)methylideneamino]imidazole-4-carboxamide isomerase [Acidimicrobiales bacterium]